MTQWLAYAYRAPGLREEGSLDLFGVGRQPVFAWVDAEGRTVGLHWDEGRVVLSGAHAPGVDTGALATMAAELDAYLFGDDGERYLADGSVADPE